MSEIQIVSKSAGGGRRPFFRRRKSCPFTGPNAQKIDYKDVRMLVPGVDLDDSAGLRKIMDANVRLQ